MRVRVSPSRLTFGILVKWCIRLTVTQESAGSILAYPAIYWVVVSNGICAGRNPVAFSALEVRVLHCPLIQVDFFGKLCYNLFMDNKQKGRNGLLLGMSYFGRQGYTISLPINDTQWYDFVIEKMVNLKQYNANILIQKIIPLILGLRVEQKVKYLIMP